jgi:hypothetical protein
MAEASSIADAALTPRRNTDICFMGLGFVGETLATRRLPIQQIDPGLYGSGPAHP